MKTSELITLLENEMTAFGDQDVVMFCPEHSGGDGEPVAVHGIGWYGNEQKNIRATFLECVECHYEGMLDKSMGDELSAIEPEPMSLDEFESL